MKQFVEQLKDSVSPSSIISRQVNLKQKGPGEYTGLCPFHSEKTPSFTVSDEKGFYHCFGCGAHGDIFSFVMSNEGISYPDAIEKIASENGMQVPKFSPKAIEVQQRESVFYEIFELSTKYYEEKLHTPEGEHALKYLRSRGLSDDIIKRFRLGYAPDNHNELKNKALSKFSEEHILESTALLKSQNSNIYNLFRGRVIFPIINKKNMVIAFGGRILGQGEPKYINSPDNPIFKKGSELYGLNFAIKSAFKKSEMILVEGYMDVISLANYGITNSVAPLGTAVKSKQIELMWRYVKEPTICMDSDAAGRRSMDKVANEALKIMESGNTLKFCLLKGAKDPDEVLTKYGKDYFTKLLEQSQPLSEYLFESAKENFTKDTPEQRIALKKRLLDMSSSIQNHEVSNGYKYFFLEKFKQLFIKKYSQKPKGINENAIISSTLSQTDPIEFVIINTYIENIELLSDSFLHEELFNMHFESKNLDKIRDSLLSIHDLSSDEAKKQSLLDLKNDFGILPQIKKLHDSDFFNWGFMHSNDQEEIKDGLLRLFKIINLKNIQEEISTIKNQLMSAPNEKTFVRLAGLKKSEEELKKETGIQ